MILQRAQQGLPLLVTTLAVALVTLSGIRVPRAVAKDAGDEFSALELSKLAAGKLVRRPVVQRRGDLHLIGGTSFQVIDAPMHVVWQALLDTAHYPRMMPEVVEAKVVRKESSRRTLFMRQGSLSMLEVKYFLNVQLDSKQRDIEFRLDDSRSNDLRKAYGFYNLRPFEGAESKRTLLSYGIMADIGSGILVSLARDKVHDWMLRTPWMVKRFIEGSGRYIYNW